VPNDQSIASEQALTPSDASLTHRLRQAFSSLSALRNIRLEFRTGAGNSVLLLDGPAMPDPLQFRLGESNGCVLLHENASSDTERFLLKTAVGAILDKAEVEKREELLLDELGTNWESLEALYEISTDVLRFGDVRNALSRLIERFASLQDGMHACLLLTRNGILHPLATGTPVPDDISWDDLGALGQTVQESRTFLVNGRGAGREHVAVVPGKVMPWTTASSLAAAPITSRRQTVIGLLLVWRDDSLFIFDAPFSRLLEAITHQASMLLESDRLNRTMLENDRLAKEIEIASSIQQTLLLGHAPVGISWLRISSVSAASQQIDGDFVDFLKHDNSVDVFIGDVMGKGIGAALVGAATKSQFLRAIANLAIQGKVPSPVDIISRAASRLGERLIELERFVTLCYARFDSVRRCIDFVDCGHTGILVHRKHTGETFFLRGEDLPLGIYMVDEWHQHSAPVMPGDTFLLFSDGVTETKDPAGELFGDERLIECLESWSSLGPDILLKQICSQAEEFRSGGPQTDDFSCIAIQVSADADDNPIAIQNGEFLCETGELPAFRGWLEASLSGIEPESMMRLEAAACEIFVNCAVHGAAHTRENPICVRSFMGEKHVRLEVRHQGPAFDPLAIPPPSFDGSRDGGFGTFIVMRSADELRYCRDGEINLISITIIRRKAPEAT